MKNMLWILAAAGKEEVTVASGSDCELHYRGWGGVTVSHSTTRGLEGSGMMMRINVVFGGGGL